MLRFATYPLLFVSGACALIYQTVWMRDFRLIFGASTPATGAVLAIFMGGLGAGGALIGRRADRHPHPLAFYGVLEMLIAASAAATPLLFAAVRKSYTTLGGSSMLGPFAATIVRLLLAALVLLLPTILMGGTLPAAARAVETSDDPRRRRVALLYGVNTFGAVAGVLASTFVVLEAIGNRRTLLVAAALNVLAGATAWMIGRRLEASEPPAKKKEPPREAVLPARFILVAASFTGFTFFLLEIVWYRMLSPLLGGTTFMFGLILAFALAGIGAGGAAYSFTGGEKVRSAGAFAVTCSLEALAIIVPFALGDRLALLANSLRTLETHGFAGHLLGWSAITLIVVFPAAAIFGFQFPLLIALLGRERRTIGRDVGLAYAWNTGGAIAAALLGGFVLLPLLGATRCWRMTTVLLVVLAIASLMVRKREKTKHGVKAIAFAAAAIACTFALGPTALWRHSGIGAGDAPRMPAGNERTEWMRAARRTLFFEADGRESSIALVSGDDLGLLVNGKSDGSARSDAGTQVMGGMIGALLHGNPRTSLVIGLGTGTTAGWMASVPSMERVDAIELEPVIVRIADAYAPVSRDVLRNPKIRIAVADARETLLTTRNRYDIIFSEPSNPYRAGVASLYTREFYEAAAARLHRGGIFLQWVQMYSIDEATVRTIYATLSNAFRNIDTWTTNIGDVVLVASQSPLVMNADALRARLREEPYRSAAHQSWRAESLEGVLAYFLASDAMADSLAREAPALNTDDRAVIEFSFARSVGRNRFDEKNLLAFAARAGAERPRVLGRVDWNAVAAHRASLAYLPSSDVRSEFARLYAQARFDEVARLWREMRWVPANTRQAATLAHALVLTGDGEAMPLIESIRAWQPLEADALTAMLFARQQRSAEAAELLARTLVRYRTDPWPLHGIMESALVDAVQLSQDPAYAKALLDALSRPYAARQLEEVRKLAYAMAAWHSGRCGPATQIALREMEPHTPWNSTLLQMRVACYQGREGLDVAKRELDEFNAHTP